MNNGGQLALVGLMIGAMIFFAAMIMIDPLSDVITEVRNTSQLDCNNDSISDGHKMTCLVVDATMPYFIGVVVAAAGAYITARYLLG